MRRLAVLLLATAALLPLLPRTARADAKSKARRHFAAGMRLSLRLHSFI